MNNFEKGIELENFVANRIKKIGLGVHQNHTWGVDIEIKTLSGVIMVEVKSANLYVSNGKNPKRKGNFSFYPNNIEKPDYFAFVINNDLNKKSTYWVEGNVIRNHFKNRKAKSKFTMGIPTLLQRIKKVDFSEVVGID